MNTGGSFRKVGFNPLSKALFGEGLVGLEGQKWATHRRIANQAFTIERVKVIIRFLYLKSENRKMIIE